MKKWSRKHNCCILCGTNSKKHYGHGKCKVCYQTEWVKKNPDTVAATKRKYYNKNKESVILRSQIQKNGEYGVFAKKHFPCCVCGSYKNLQCHHIDRKGHNVKKSLRNNDLSNIVVMCASCHGSMHGKQAKGIPKRKSNQLEID